MSTETELRATIACRTLNISKRDWLEKAATAQLERDRVQLQTDKFNAAKVEARAKRQPEPLAHDFGLPAAPR